MQRTRIVVLALVALVALAASGLFSAAAAHAQVPDFDTPDFVEHIDDYEVVMDVAPDGTVAVTETIVYNFGMIPKHGIFRDLVQREVYGNDGKYDRLYKLDVTSVTQDGKKAKVKESTKDGFLNVRIGDPDREIEGRHTYVISYTVKGALTSFENHIELYWDVIGHLWPVPIDHATIRVTMPADITKVACFSGSEGSRLGCDEATSKGAVATFEQRRLFPREGVTVVIGLPPDAITPPPQPILEKRWNVDDAFARRPDTIGLGAGIAVLLVGGVMFLLWHGGRDRRYRGSAVDQAFGNTTGEEEPIAPFGKRAGPVEFVPPEGLRPGQVGVLIDENANLLDITATIIDLAVRGYLTITELEPEGFFRRRPDYQLERIDRGDTSGELLHYERKILSGLFAHGNPVKLSELKYRFRDKLTGIRDAMYKDAVKQGWFRRRPDHTRAIWTGIGIGVVVVSIGLTVLVARFTSYGLVPLAGVLAGLVLLAVASRMPARTGKGSAMLSRVRGFRRLFDEGDEDLRARFAENHKIFSEYLPYAIVFGCTKKWAKAFEGLDAEELGTANWYGGHPNLTAFALAGALDDFGTTATGTLYASQPSSSSGSGFGGGGSSGGGGGGGGGGSW